MPCPRLAARFRAFVVAEPPTFPRPNAAYFDPSAPRRPDLRARMFPLPSHLDSSPVAPRGELPQNWILAIVLAIACAGLALIVIQGP